MNKKQPQFDNALSAELRRIGQDLIKNQQPLGDKFAKVLNDHRDELYESGDNERKSDSSNSTVARNDK